MLFLDNKMSMIPISNPEEVTSAINAAFEDFLAVEPSTTDRFVHHQQNIDPEILTTNNDLSSNNRPPTPYAVSTHTNSGKKTLFFFKKKFNK